MAKLNPELTIVMPALNEQANILQALTNTLKAFDTHKISGEIVVINDGNTDDTARIVAEVIEQDPRVSIVHHDRPHGLGAGFWEGVDHARGSLICMLPGDNENDPIEIFQYIRLLDQVDMVIPFVFNREVRSIFRNAVSFLYRFIINTTFLVNFNYTNGTVMFRKSALQQIKVRSSGFFYLTDILVRLVKRGYLFAEVPYRLNVREGDVSKAITFPSLLQVIRGYIQLVKGIYLSPYDEVPRQWPAGSQTLRRRNAAEAPPSSSPNGPETESPDA